MGRCLIFGILTRETNYCSAVISLTGTCQTGVSLPLLSASCRSQTHLFSGPASRNFLPASLCALLFSWMDSSDRAEKPSSPAVISYISHLLFFQGNTFLLAAVLLVWCNDQNYRCTHLCNALQYKLEFL